jgi:hypothetical protein
MTDPGPITNYQSYRGLPTLAGLATVAEAARPGLGVADCVARLEAVSLRLQEAARDLHRPHHGRADLRAEDRLRPPRVPLRRARRGAAHRVGEMREPPLGLEAVPDPALEVLFDEIRAAPTTGELLVGLYETALPALDAALARHLDETNPLADAPSVRVCRFARLELADMIDFGRRCVACLVDTHARAGMLPWLDLLDDCLAAAGGLDGAGAPSGQAVARLHSATPYAYDPVPRRDERFQDLDNQGVNAEAFLYNPAFDARSKALMMLFKRLREIDVPEMMASIIHQTPGQPWGYYRDMSRQLWDEARHAMLGEVGFAALGVDWTRARITHNWSLRLNTECTPLERHAVLYFIEQGLMAKTGKRYEWEVALQSGDPLLATIQDYDWADEVLHAAIGRDWYIPQVGHWKQALDYGDRCWSRILSNWHEVRDRGPDAARELVARDLPAGLRALGDRARRRGPGVRRDVRGPAGRPQGGLRQRLSGPGAQR